MDLNAIVLLIAGTAVASGALLLGITAVVIHKKNHPKPRYKRTPEEQVDEYVAVLNNPAFFI